MADRKAGYDGRHGDKSDTDEKSPEKKTYTYQDLIKFSSTEIYSGFGEMRTSDKPSSPLFSFGTSTRDAEPKKFTSKQMAKIDCFGKATPQGPDYEPTDKFQYPENSGCKFGTELRNTLEASNKYQFYNQQQDNIDVLKADRYRRYNTGNVRIGGEARLPPMPKMYKTTPGPQYNPSLPLEIPKSPEYSLYARRSVKGFDPLIQLNSTPSVVGPGSYNPHVTRNNNSMENKPEWSLPKGPKLGLKKKSWDIYQTYDTTSSVGSQYNSQKKSLPAFSTGKAPRDTPAGIFKEHMSNRPMQVKIQHLRI